MNKVINFEDAVKKAKELPDAVGPNFLNFAEWYATYLEHKSNLAQMLMSCSNDAAEEACQYAALNFKNFHFIPQSLLSFLDAAEGEENITIPCAVYVWMAKSGSAYTLSVTVSFSDDEEDDAEFTSYLEKKDKDGKCYYYDYNLNVWVEDIDSMNYHV